MTCRRHDGVDGMAIFSNGNSTVRTIGAVGKASTTGGGGVVKVRVNGCFVLALCLSFTNSSFTITALIVFAFLLHISILPSTPSPQARR